MYNRHGSVFQSNYKKKEILNDLYFYNLVVYIHRNPVASGLVCNQDEYQFSSYRHLLSDEITFLKRKEMFDKFYGKQNFIAFHKNETFEFQDFKSI